MEPLTKEQLKNNAVSNFRHIRKGLKYTQDRMAQKVGLTRNDISAIEEGRACTAYHVYLLSQYANVSIDTLYTTELSNQNQ